MGHPHDPETHSHHNSVWISHNDVNGTSFWSDSGKGMIRHKRIVNFEDADEQASLVAENEWINNDGGGKILNSVGAVNEKEVLWKKARWVDYSGAITNGKLEGITLFDHPDNPNFPGNFHVRNDGWMGATLTFDGPREIPPDKPLHLRYGLYVHSDMKSSEAIDTQWKKFTEIPTAISE